jgi:hypothetical protein
VRNDIEYSVCTTTTTIPAIATSGNNSSETLDHFGDDFDRRFRRLLAGATVVEVSAAIIENFGRLPAELTTPVAGLLLRRLLVGAVVIEADVAVIENCEQLPVALLGTAVGELLLLGLGPVGTDTGGAVIENCEVSYKLPGTPVAETCFD